MTDDISNDWSTKAPAPRNAPGSDKICPTTSDKYDREKGIEIIFSVLKSHFLFLYDDKAR